MRILQPFIFLPFFCNLKISSDLPLIVPSGDLTFRVIPILLCVFVIGKINMFASMYFQDYIPVMPNDYLGVWC